MAFTHLQAAPEQPGVLSRVASAFALLLDDRGAVDIVTFAESPEYLNRPLYRRQRLILKLYYKLELTDEELEDTKLLLSCTNRYAKLYFPGLCQHHILGTCARKKCLKNADKSDYRTLSDDELRARLRSHYAHLLLVIAGRRGSKSVLGAIVNCFELYKLLREPNAALKWGLIAGQPIGTVNVATSERQALDFFDQQKALIANSPWFQKVTHRPLESIIDFPGRAVYARSLHSNSAAIRGQTLINLNIDEFCFFNQTTGKQSDKAMMDAIGPSVVTFKDQARIVITSSPFTRTGEGYRIFQKAEEGESGYTLAFQMAAWEMNETLTPADPEIARKYEDDREAAEIEFGGMWADQAGQYIPWESIDACGNSELTFQTHGKPGVKYVLHLDLALKKDRCGLVICHYDKERGKVLVDRVEEWDPENDDDDMVNPVTHEIDYQRVFEHIVALYEQYKFRFQWISFDQFNSAWLRQELRKKFGDYKGEWIEELTFTDRTNREIFANLRSLIRQNGIEYYRHIDLMKQLGILGRTIKPSGAWKVEAPPGFHDDLADALAAAAFMCLQLALGITHGVVTTRPSEGADRLAAAAAKRDPRFDEKTQLRHSDKCDRHLTFCHYDCPVRKARLRARRT